MSERIDGIDGLRAIAMTMVVAQHCSLLPFGWTGVWLFYAISGFVISRQFLSGSYDAPTFAGTYKIFMLRRFWRIVPVYALYVLINVSLALAEGKTAILRELPFLLTFTYNWQMIFEFVQPSGAGAFGHLWTVSVEEQFYLFFPLLMLALSGRRFLIVAGLLIIGGPLIRVIYSAALIGADGDAGWKAFSIYAASITQFDAFLTGAVLARCTPYFREHPRAAWYLLAGAAIVAASYALVYSGINRANGAQGVEALRNIFSGILYGEGREMFVYSVINLASASVLIATVLRKQFIAPLSWSPLTFVGRISYGAYLYHALVLALLVRFVFGDNSGNPLPERVLFFTTAWSITVFFAYVSFKYFEKPIMDWSKRKPSRYDLSVSSEKPA
ncbi:MAG: acyltransferase [Chitinophagales bacterium]|nr:acyltransferase [Hyphomicrobiales bacterium]